MVKGSTQGTWEHTNGGIENLIRSQYHLWLRWGSSKVIGQLCFILSASLLCRHIGEGCGRLTKIPELQQQILSAKEWILNPGGENYCHCRQESLKVTRDCLKHLGKRILPDMSDERSVHTKQSQTIPEDKLQHGHDQWSLTIRVFLYTENWI